MLTDEEEIVLPQQRSQGSKLTLSRPLLQPRIILPISLTVQELISLQILQA